MSERPVSYPQHLSSELPQKWNSSAVTQGCERSLLGFRHEQIYSLTFRDRTSYTLLVRLVRCGLECEVTQILRSRSNSRYTCEICIKITGCNPSRISIGLSSRSVKESVAVSRACKHFWTLSVLSEATRDCIIKPWYQRLGRTQWQEVFPDNISTQDKI